MTEQQAMNALHTQHSHTWIWVVVGIAVLLLILLLLGLSNPDMRRDNGVDADDIADAAFGFRFNPFWWFFRFWS